MEANYPYLTQPFPHQGPEFESTRDKPHWGLFWEMGVAKTKVIIDTASWLWLQGKIDGVLVIAPEGVHQQWVLDEIPDHMPLIVQDSLDTIVWSTAKQKNKGWRKIWEAFRDRPVSAGLSVMTMTYDSLMTQRVAGDEKGLQKGANAAKAFLEGRRILFVLDESTRIKTPGTKITKRLLAMAKYAPIRRVMNGTPVADSPFNSYAQIKFLNPDAWKFLGIRDASGFRTYFGVFDRKYNAKQRRYFDEIVGYKNLDVMAKVVAEHGSRLLKKDVFPNLPPKLYSSHYFEMTPKQNRTYQELAKKFMTWLDTGELVTADLAIVRQTRLQQITSGYLPADDDEELTPLVLPKDNPRLKLLIDLLQDVSGKVIVWAKYDIDVDLIAEAIREKFGWNIVTWDGRTSRDDRSTAKARFVDPNGARAFIAKASSSAGRGLNLQVADTVVYYNNSFVLDDRLQSEDRAHRPGIHHPVKYIDLIAKGTIDEHILRSLRNKRNVAALVTGDELSPWVA